MLLLAGSARPWRPADHAAGGTDGWRATFRCDLCSDRVQVKVARPPAGDSPAALAPKMAAAAAAFHALYGHESGIELVAEVLS